MDDATDDFQLLEIDVATTFVISPTGRIEREQDPDSSPGPRLFFAGCAAGNIAHVRHDVGDDAARRVLTGARGEPPWSDPAMLPHCLDELTALLSRDAPVRTVSPAFIYSLPDGLIWETGATIVGSDSHEGQRLLARLADEGMPPPLVDAGFLGVGDFWEPWCAALVHGEIASIAFAARLGGHGAEIGAFTVPGFRGTGLAAAVSARWSCLPALAGRALFYSTQRTNLSSQRVAARLGLRRFAASVRIE
jgi:hypothetical protein